MQQITGNIAANNQKINTILTNTAQATRQFTPLMESGTNAMTLFRTQTLPAAYKMLYDLDEMSRNLSEISLELRHDPSVLLRGVAARPLGPGERK